MNVIKKSNKKYFPAGSSFPLVNTNKSILKTLRALARR